MITEATLTSPSLYTPDVDGQALIDALSILVIHRLRWGWFVQLWDREPHELVIEALICQFAWGYDYNKSIYLTHLIMTFGWSLMPYAKYRATHPPQGVWGGEWGERWQSAAQRALSYKMACDFLVEASQQELLRD